MFTMRRTSSLLSLLKGVTAALLALSLIAGEVKAAGLDNNATSINGTWSSGSGGVTTGINFFNPAQSTFSVPKTAGISYSFTEDGHWEQSKYIFDSNPTLNRCVKANLIWQHGTYTFNANGSLSLKPFAPDGYIQVIDMCGGTTIQTYSYNQFELIPEWYIYVESAPQFAASGSQTAFALQMYTDGGGGQAGAKMAPMYLVARPGNMLPTQQLHEEVLNAMGAGLRR